MSWSAPSTFVAGAILTAAQMNTHVRDNPNELRGGGIAITSMAANDFVYAASASQLARLAAATGVPRFSGSAWAFASALLAVGSQAANDFLYASSATALARLAAVARTVPYFDGSNWVTSPSGALVRAAARVDVSGGASLIWGFNVSGVSYNGTGDVTVTFTNTMPSANYAAVANPMASNVRLHASCYSQGTGSLRVFTYDDANATPVDGNFNLIVVGG